MSVILNKFEWVVRHLQQSGALDTQQRLLDVGCRGCELKPYVIRIGLSYQGVDLFQNSSGTVDHVLDVTGGLPFASASYDYVVALDLVEHLDDFIAGLDELFRVTNKTLIVVLPNMAHAWFRFRFLFKGDIADKYAMHYKMGLDRHRWVTTQAQCDALMQAYAADHNADLSVEWMLDTPKKHAFGRICRALGLSPNVWVWASFYTLTKR